MNTLGYILLFTFLGSIFSLIGGILLLSKEKLAGKISHYLSSFAAGVLLGAAFLDLLPEAMEIGEEAGTDHNIFLWTLIGILIFFLLERFIHWFHHHHIHSNSKAALIDEASSIVPLVTLGDSVHNFIDGIIIAATFLVSIPLGITTALAVAAHEIPQEIGDFGILIHRGVKRKKVLLLNIVSALASFAGALLTFYMQDIVLSYLPVALSVAAGFFIYIAASDLIPEIHNEDRRMVALLETLLLLVGVVVIYLSVLFLEGSH